MSSEVTNTKGAAASLARESATRNSQPATEKSAPAGVRLRRALFWLSLLLVAATLLSLWVGYQRLDLPELWADERARLIFFRLRLPRVVMAGVVGGSLGAGGAALQAIL
jgi:ABC-type cobalamin transport system permease subunit